MSEPQQTLTIQQTLELAVQHHKAGRLSEAEGIYHQILQSDPNQANALHLLGTIAHAAGKNDTAVKLITKALTIKPNFAEAHNNLGTALHALGSLDEAAASYRRAFGLKPDYAEAHNNLGVVLQDLGKLDEALASLQRALAIKPDYAETHHNLASTFRKLGKLNEASVSYRKALRLKPDYVEAYGSLGIVLREMGKRDGALASYQKALRLRPDYAEGHNNLGTALYDLGKLDDALASYQKALAIKPDYIEAQYNLGVTFRDLGKLDDAVQCLKRTDPDTMNPRSSSTLLECYYRKGDREGFKCQLERISNNQRFNFRAASASAFVSHQWGIPNTYKFCDNPIDLVAVYDLLDTGDLSTDLIMKIENKIKNNSGDESFAPGHISVGFKSTGNLFAEKSPVAAILEQTIRRCVKKFVRQTDKNQGRLFQDWPAEYILDGWYIRMLNGGKITAHVHEGWLSGVFYVRVPAEKENNAGNIEFTLNGYNLPVIQDDFPRRVVTTKPGRLVLFPSSLPHRVYPFLSSEERISISFDIVPAEVFPRV